MRAQSWIMLFSLLTAVGCSSDGEAAWLEAQDALAREDYAAYVKHMEHASDAGVLDAMAARSELLSWGKLEDYRSYGVVYSVERDTAESRRLSMKVTEGYRELLKTDSLNENANIWLGEVATAGPEGADAAYPFYEAAIRGGSVRALYLRAMSECYRGDDVERGVAMLKEAADAQYPPAEYAYGRELIKGRGVPVDTTTGLAYVRRAAEARFAHAERYLRETKAAGVPY